MTTIGWVFILVGLIVMRQSINGRTLGNIPSDIGTMLRGAATSLQSPTEGAKIIKDVLALRGTGDSSASSVVAGSTESITITGAAQGSALLTEMKRLATACGNKYVWGATGPKGYDCSGLVWAAMRNMGYTGLRFTTYNFVSQMAGKITKTTTPQGGEIVLWPSHIGVMESPSTMFSALNPREGIMSSPISYGPKDEGNPTFWILHFTETRKVNG